MKQYSQVLVFALILSLFAGCAGKQSDANAHEEPVIGSVELNVVTSFGADDGNRPNYEAACKAFEAATGHIVRDASVVSNESWKRRVNNDFETGAEPDVLFYFSGVDANRIVSSKKVVSLDEIREVYPDYAVNMKEDWLLASPADGKKYTVPVNGYWEALYVNKKVLADCGVEVPGSDYTWEQFLADCQVIADKGYTPIACALDDIPHYWFEFAILNNGSIDTHMTLPTSSQDPAAQPWIDGLNDIKDLYDRGFFPQNTTTATDSETFQLMADHKAAFALDGSWKIGWFYKNAEDINDYTIVYVPGKGDRPATDIISGLSMGYYITRKAWEDPEKQKASVDFVMAMTTDEVVNDFGATAVTALKRGTVIPEDADVLAQDALNMIAGATGFTPAVQDLLNQNARTALFNDIKHVVTGNITPEDAIDNCLAIVD